jgi:hypothetical protein
MGAGFLMTMAAGVAWRGVRPTPEGIEASPAAGIEMAVLGAIAFALQGVHMSRMAFPLTSGALAVSRSAMLLCLVWHALQVGAGSVAAFLDARRRTTLVRFRSWAMIWGFLAVTWVVLLGIFAVL